MAKQFSDEMGLMRQYGQGLDRLLGLRPKDMLELAANVNSLSVDQIRPIKPAMDAATSPQQMASVLRMIEKARRPGQGLPALDQSFEGGVSSGRIDIPQFNVAVAGLGENDRQVVAREVAGPRNVVSMGSLLDYRAGRAAYHAPIMPIPSSLAEQTAVVNEQTAAKSARDNQPDPFEATFADQVERETPVVDRNGDETKSFFERNPTFTKAMTLGAAHPASSQDIAAGRVLTRRLVELARIRAGIVAGTTKATPAQAKQLQDSIAGIMGLLQQTDQQPDTFQALAGGSYTRYADGQAMTTTADQALKEYDADPEQFLRTELNTVAISDFSGSIKDDRKAGPALRQAAAAESGLTGTSATPAGPLGPPAPARQQPPPTTRPAGPPVSVNYNIRQTNYGYSSDAVGAPAQFANSYG